MLKSLILASLLTQSAFAYEIIAHRGSSGVTPENTLAAIKKAEEQKAHYIEIDIHATKDNHVVVLHDRSVNRTTSGKGDISSLTLEEVRALDAGSWFSKDFSNEKILTLEEVFQAIKPETKLIIEFKYGKDKYPDIEKKVIELVRTYKLSDRVILKSFDSSILKTFEILAPELPRLYVLVASWGRFTIDNSLHFREMMAIDNVEYYQVHKYFLTETLIKKVHEKGKKIIAWGVKPEDKEKMVKLGVDLVEVDYPDLFL